MTVLRLLLGDQLNPQHAWFASVDPGVLYVLMEVRQETDYVLHHAQKILAIFAAMREFARQLQVAGHRHPFPAARRRCLGGRLVPAIPGQLRHHGGVRFHCPA